MANNSIFSNSPYFDDFDETKNYLKVLFSTNNPLQARELNTIQSIFQNQLKQFANNIFKNGTRVSNARSNIVNYTRLYVTYLPFQNFKEGMYLIGRESNQKANFITIDDNQNIICDLVGSNLYKTQSSFFQDEEIMIYDANNNYLASTYTINDAVFHDKCKVFIIDDGIFYYDGYFIENKKQMMIIDPTLLNYEIGFSVVRQIVSANYDASLLDNNENPIAYKRIGADRFRIRLDLNIRYTDGNTANKPLQLFEEFVDFIPLVNIKDGYAFSIIDQTQYAKLGDYIAQRTYEESGNYVLNPFKMQLMEHKATTETDANGLSVDGLEENYVVKLQPSTAYVKGNRISIKDNIYLVGQKSRDTFKKSGFIFHVNENAYVRAIPTQSSSVYPNKIDSSIINDDSIISIFDDEIGSNNLPQGNKIGEMKISDLRLENSNNSIYRYYVSDISFIAGKGIKDAKSIANTSNNFQANLYDDEKFNYPTIYNKLNNSLLIDLGKTNIKSLRSIDNPQTGSTIFVKRKKYSTLIDSNGVATFRTNSGEYFINPSKSTIFVLTDSNNLSSSISINQNNIVFNNQTITINALNAFSGKTLSMIIDVSVMAQFEKTKTTKSYSETFNDIKQMSYTLSKSDIISFKVFKKNIIDQSLLDITDKFTLFNGQTDYAYINGVINRKNSLTTEEQNENATNFQLLIQYYYFEHSGNSGYFTVDSYIDIDYKDIPIYYSSNNIEYRLENSIDYRPLVLNNQIVNPSIVFSPNSSIITDLEYYLPKIDLVCAHKNNYFVIIKGTSSENPIPPTSFNDDYIELYQLNLPAYVRNVNEISKKLINNKCYTMADIGNLENRLSNVEYYTSLNLMEQNVANLQIKDVNGLNRFKNGFIVDNFQDFQAADLFNSEFKAAIDPDRNELHPSFKARNIKLKLVNTNGKNINNVIMIPYEHFLLLKQEFATNPASINPGFVFNKIGKIELFPNNDTWSNSEVEEKTINVDTGLTSALTAFQEAYRAKHTYGAWQLQNTTIQDTNLNSETTISTATNAVQQIVNSNNSPVNNYTISNNIVVDTSTIATTRTTFNETTTQTFKRDGITIEERQTKYSVGTAVTGAQLSLYLRSIDVQFHAYDMLPNTIVFPLFDDIRVDQYCRPINGVFGDLLITDENGELWGVFRIPANTFFAGQKIFKLISNPNGD